MFSKIKSLFLKEVHFEFDRIQASIMLLFKKIDALELEITKLKSVTLINDLLSKDKPGSDNKPSS